MEVFEMNYLIKQNFLPTVFHLIALAENIIRIMLSIAPTTKAVLTELLVLLLNVQKREKYQVGLHQKI